MSNNDEYESEFAGWENLMGPEQRAEEQARDSYQCGYRAGYDEGERDGYNRARAELEAARESKVSKGEGQASSGQGGKGPAGSTQSNG